LISERYEGLLSTFFIPDPDFSEEEKALYPSTWEYPFIQAA